MIRRGDWTSPATYVDRETPLDPASERSAGLMLHIFRSHQEDSGPVSLHRQFASNDEPRAARADATPSASPDLPAVFDLADLNGRNGSLIEGVDAFGHFGSSVSDAGDVNGDGFADIIIGARYANRDDGESYVVFGTAGGFGETFDVASLDGTNGFRLFGRTNSYSGFSVSSAGDFNGDGFDDVMVLALNVGGRRGHAENYLVYGKADGFAVSIDLGGLAPGEGVIFTGHRLDTSVSLAGDFNGDGIDDVIVGSGYVVFGATGGVPPEIDLDDLDGTDGFRIVGASLAAVSSAGDINGDGFDDVVMGSRFAGQAGEAYVVFGHAGAFAASVDLTALDGADGFRLHGPLDEPGDLDDYENFGVSVSSAGDVNGDGYDEIIIGAPGEDTVAGVDYGRSYVVFGGAGAFAATLDVTTLDGTNGFRLEGADGNSATGFSVSSAGDVNGDGFDDLIIGARYAGPDDVFDPDYRVGASYVVFGHAGGFDATLDLASLDGTNGFRLDGINGLDDSGTSVSSAGDVDGDGFDDLLIGARQIDGLGETYVLYGRAPTEAVTRIGSAADQTIRGGDFDDILRGKQGDDTLAGGGGHDRLNGGGGADDFLLASLRAVDADTIVDFGRGADRIALDGGVFGFAEGPLAAKRFVVGDAAADANDRLIYDDTTGQLFFDADGTSAQVQILIAMLTSAPPLTATDFIVI